MTGQCLGFVGQNADLTAAGAEVRRIALPHQQTAVFVGGRLAAQAAGQLIGCGQVGVFIGRDERRGDAHKQQSARKADHRHGQRQRGTQAEQQYGGKRCERQQRGQPVCQIGRPAAGVVGHILQCQRGVGINAVRGQGQRPHRAGAGPEAERPLPLDDVIDVQTERFRLRRRVGRAEGKAREVVIKNVGVVARRLAQDRAVGITQIDHDHTGAVQLPVGAEPQAAAIERLPRLQRDGLPKPVLGYINDLGIVIVCDFIDRLIADAQLQIIADPAAEQPDRRSGSQRRHSAGEDAAQGEFLFHRHCLSGRMYRDQCYYTA